MSQDKQLFEADPYPGKPKILFIGLANSTHTHSWIDLLSDSDLNVRLFAVPEGLPPKNWKVKTYISGFAIGLNNSFRQYRYFGIIGFLQAFYNRIARKTSWKSVFILDFWLAEIINQWKPDIIHTLGMFDDQGGYLYYQVRKKYILQDIGKWILQTRGGSDLALRRNDPEVAPIIREMFKTCHQIISDNTTNIRYARDLGIAPEKFADMVPVPGTGGMDIIELSRDILPPSKRERIILWPKAYETQWSKAFPVLEALQLAWEKIGPCEIYMLAITPEVQARYLQMPKKIRQHCHVYGRIARNQVLTLMKRSRIVLILSLVDGIPNSLYEAMATGAFPVVSPLETIKPVVENEKNVLFANNLVPEEISSALISAMNDDALVDRGANENLKLVKDIADREIIKAKVIQSYVDWAQ